MASRFIAQALRRGGRIFFIGAGTSGRLGVVEAAEMPPTFGTSPASVQAIMAGGKDAVFKAKEGVEDDYEEGARAIARLRPNKKDVIIGVSASGLTPFVRGGLTRARKSGLRIIFVTCWPGADLQNFVDLVIAPSVGPEVLTGSTRLKAATATKMVLNMLTTIAMVRIGKAYGNLMVDVQANSQKLKDRARRIVGIVTGIGYDSADELLRRARWNVKIAVVMHRTGSSYTGAVAKLKQAEGSTRDAIGEDIEPRLRALLHLDEPKVKSDVRQAATATRQASRRHPKAPSSASRPHARDRAWPRPTEPSLRASVYFGMRAPPLASATASATAPCAGSRCSRWTRHRGASCVTWASTSAARRGTACITPPDSTTSNASSRSPSREITARALDASSRAPTVRICSASSSPPSAAAWTARATAAIAEGRSAPS